MEIDYIQTALPVFLLVLLSFFLNYPLGRWRSRYRKFTLPWWLLIHASIPVLFPLRILFKVPIYSIPFFIVLAILGQYLGAKRGLRNNRKITDAE